MEKQTKVIDASVVIKWFLNEENSDKAISLREKHVNEEVILIAPELLILEVVNAIRYKDNRKDVLDRVKKDIFDMQLKIEPVSEFILGRAIDIAITYDSTIYDSVYAALAQIHGVEFITADEDLYKMPNALPLGKA